MKLNATNLRKEILNYPAEIFPETHKYLNWIIDRVENHGLLSVDYFKSDTFSGDTEEVCGELNRMIEAPILKDCMLDDENWVEGKGYVYESRKN